MSFTLGDALFQLFSIGLVVLIIVLIMSFFRSNKKRKNQLDRMKQKINEIDAQIKKGNYEGPNI
ncbi:DUF4083 domain-containing protein [Sutcliffiella rhizosphaerae]|uniref:DUF4083 domain-containing protein n=1 Tax=Sutcliffiella rhizosphaerae TaxID=2880967 RepID=A0ABM8YN32_9BACI|nr:DUF4083 domain-containing protein [Sutcliffiella rhizosphaerae]CAG9621292.1 hypothetical protein BACCIP111883_02064 [Sutcliffiella rhizosphaerae]